MEYPTTMRLNDLQLRTTARMNLRQKMQIQKTWYGLKFMSLQISHLEAAAPVWWYLETGRLSAVTWGHEGGASMNRGRETRACVFSLSLSAMWKHSRKTATWKPGRQPSPELDHAGTLISNFQPPEMGENTFRLFRQQKQWHVVMAAQADQDRKNARAEKVYLASKQKLPDRQEVKHDL